MLLQDDFEDGDAAGWTAVSGTWSITTDGTKVYKQSSTSGEAIAYAGSDTWTDYVYEANVKLSSTNGNVGLVFRYSDASNFYMLRLNDNGDKVELYKRVGGTLTLIASSAQTVTPGQLYVMKVVVEGNKIIGYVDGVEKINWTNATTQLTSGKIGFRMHTSSASVDNIQITTSLPAPTPIQTVTPTPTPTPDTAPPVLTVPTDVTVTATAKLTPVTLGTASAVDLVDGLVAVASNAPLVYPVGSTVVTFTAADSSGNVATENVTVTVLNASPVLAPVEIQTVDEAQLLEFVVGASDPNEDPIAISVENLPAGAVFDPATAKFSWKPEFTQSGAYTVMIRVSDGQLTDNKSVSITVNHVTAADLITESIEYIVLQADTAIHGALTSKLEVVTDSLEKGNVNAAINKLHAFVNSVEAQRGKKLTEEQANALLQAAATIEYVIGLN
jgi:hypothetical protein